jgi:serine/threonine protein kinase
MNDKEPSQEVEVIVKTALIVSGATGKIPIDDLIEAYPQLMPDLATALKRASVVRRASIAATSESASAETETVFLSQSRNANHSGLTTGNVRCPICFRYLLLDENASNQQVRCNACGADFALVGGGAETKMPATIGKFQILARLGSGGFGVVWKGRDPELDRLVAIKVPRPDAISTSELDAFMAEARFVAQLRHPGIVRVYQVGREEDRVFIVSDLIDGPPLTDWIRSGGVSCEEAVELCIQVADALEHAHNAGIIHRDLKPANILLDRHGKPHITDFGLAVHQDRELIINAEGQIVGTPAYMSPEQAIGRDSEIGPRSDIYSLGTVLFEMLTGERPFRGDVRIVLHRVIHDEPPRPRELRRSIPRDLENIVLKCLQKDPHRRYSSAAEFASDLRNWSAGEPIIARPLGSAERLQRWCLRNPVVAVGFFSSSLMLVLLTLGMFSVATLQKRDLAAAIHELEQHHASRQAEFGAIESHVVKMAAQLEAEAVPTRNWKLASEILETAFHEFTIQGAPGTVSVESFHIQDPKGVIEAIYPHDDAIVGRDFSQRDYFQGALKYDLPGLYISRPYRSVHDGLYKIAISSKLKFSRSGDATHNSNGILSASIATSSSRAIAREDRLARRLTFWATIAILPVVGFAIAIGWSEWKRHRRRSRRRS